MKIITWNCNGAFRNKYKTLNKFDADILIIQECENPLLTNDLLYKDFARNYLWIGDNKNKGLGIFAKEGIQLKRLQWSSQYKDHFVKYFLPCRVNNEFDLLAVWTHKNNSPNFGYIGQLWKYLQINKTKLGNTLIVGDFNSNSIWDEWDRWWNHTDVVDELKEYHIESFYHDFFNQLQGNESKATFYFQRKFEKPYHIDYIFGSYKLLKKLIKFEIGVFSEWIELSDHMPLMCEMKSDNT
ncbi:MULTISPECIES: endonuclease/exonuclease/phosphatase family protein [Myroides]|uniref:endonuclease/exonuclease/phosphatase family protein n=1 Tax=Myroides TaxID=76831 RepID=UPI0015FA3848|nr:MULTISPECIES: endonuclease/exonuclease/phosphatase family protein [Myroides]MBB1140721.1 endonuclease/exonuclease/phosphatase family protein [Myroides sp. WP-1]MEC4043138.1 endonuclease/exonuclease/phosphatase family protein [Myroides odoratimimus]MEC4151031.1 endonuclease/exonuclease/phosphatase family protein [Myroides odoratimimus]